jgi:hypothetical protein
MSEELKQYLDIDFMEIAYEDDSISIVDVLVMHEGLNRKQCDISHEVILKSLTSLSNKPIWGIPNKKYLKDYSDDFIEHARNEEEEKDIVIFGVYPESGVKNAQFIEKDNKTYLKVQAILFKKYSPLAMKILNNRDGNCKISIEILAKGNTVNGVLVVNELFHLSTCILGESVLEGIQGSSMEIVRFSLDEAIKESNEKYLQFASIEENKLIVEENIKIGEKTEEDEKTKEIDNSNAQIIVDISTINIDNGKEINNKEVDLMENKKIEFSLNSTQIFEIFANAIDPITYQDGNWESRKYWTEAYDECVVFLRDCEEGKTYKMPYTLQDNVATIDFEKKVCVISGGYLEVGMVSEEMKNAQTEMEEMKNKVSDFEQKYSDMEQKFIEIEQKYSDMEIKYNKSEEENIKNKAEIEKFAKQEEMMKMSAMLEQFAHTVTEEETKELKEKMTTATFAEFEEMMNIKIKEFALNSKKEDEIKKIDNSFKISFSNFGGRDHYNYESDKNKLNDMASIIEKSGVKIK